MNLSNTDLYLNISKQNTTNDNEPINFRVSADSNIIDKASNFKASIARLDLPANIPKRNFYTPDVELLIRNFIQSGVVIDESNENDQFINSWSVSLVYEVIEGDEIYARAYLTPFKGLNSLDPDIQKFVDWSQGETNIVIDSFAHITYSLNNALQRAFIALKDAYNTRFGANQWENNANKAQEAPFFDFNTQSETWTLYNPIQNRNDLNTDANLNQISGEHNSNKFLISVNRGLYTYLRSFPGSLTGKQREVGDYFVFESNLLPLIDANRTELFTTDELFPIFQEYKTTNLWYDIYKVVLISKNLPNRPQLLIYETDNVDNKLRFSNILTDFDFTFNYSNAERITYSASGNYEWFDLFGDSIQDIDVEFYYTTKTAPDTLLQMTLLPGEDFSIKILFREKMLQPGGKPIPLYNTAPFSAPRYCK